MKKNWCLTHQIDKWPCPICEGKRMTPKMKATAKALEKMTKPSKAGGYTPEPWVVPGGMRFTVIQMEKGVVVCSAGGCTPEEVDANARRIVACVNACAGIPTEKLEGASVAGLVKSLRECLLALERLTSGYVLDEKDMARIVLAKFEGK